VSNECTSITFDNIVDCMTCL